MTRLFALLAVVLASLSTPSLAIEITYSSVNPFNGMPSPAESIMLRGEIGPGDYESLLSFISRDQDRFWRSMGITLASPGGDVQESLKIARLVKGTYFPVFVGESTGRCASACFFIYAAAVRRDAATRTLGIHRPYVHPKRLISASVVQAESLQRDALKEARGFLESQDIPTALIDKMFQLASNEIYWLSQEEVAEQVGRRPPWYEQFLIAKCGLEKSAERRYFLTSDSSILSQLIAADTCGLELTAKEGRAFLRTELQRTPKLK